VSHRSYTQWSFSSSNRKSSAWVAGVAPKIQELSAEQPFPRMMWSNVTLEVYVTQNAVALHDSVTANLGLIIEAWLYIGHRGCGERLGRPYVQSLYVSLFFEVPTIFI
jgi:hypothetical protein